MIDKIIHRAVMEQQLITGTACRALEDTPGDLILLAPILTEANKTICNLLALQLGFPETFLNESSPKLAGDTDDS